MASISVPCAKCSSLPAKPKPPTRHSFVPASTLSLHHLQLKKWKGNVALKAQTSEVVESSTNSKPVTESLSVNLEAQLSDPKDRGLTNGAVPLTTTGSSISTFLAEVSNIIKLVDSTDITELQLKKMDCDCELLIRKKGTLRVPPATPVVMTHSPPQLMLPQFPLPLSSTPAPAAPAPIPAAEPPFPAKTKNASVPALKCPMAGTFYRCPAPGEPPFVKVGDRVQKGQVVCIIEAMKLMNEIEVDHSGTITDIIAEDGKPVSVDSPLLVIQP